MARPKLHTDNTWLSRIAGYLYSMVGVPSGSNDGNGSVLKTGGEYNATPYTYADGARVAMQMDSKGNQKVVSGNLLAASAASAFPLGANDINGQIRIVDVGSAGDGINYPLATMMYGFTGGSTVRKRIANIFKTVQASASGNTAVWTPTAGKKFRLTRFKIDIPANAAISGGGVVLTVKFQDATTDINVATDIFVPAIAVTTGVGGFTTGWIDLDNGVISALANNVLNINLSSALTTSAARVSVAGTEE